MADSEFTEWCEDNSWVGEAGQKDGAPYEGRCYKESNSSTDTYGYTYVGDWRRFGILSILIGLISLASMFFGRKREWYCGACQEQIEKQALLEHTRFDVRSTSASSKKVTTSSPQLGMGVIGGTSGSFLSMGSTTSHIPTVLGRIQASHVCQTTHCSAINQWQFDGEVQVWTDAVTSEVSHDITGKIQVPR